MEEIKLVRSNKNSALPSGERQQYSFADELEGVSMESDAREDICPLAAVIQAVKQAGPIRAGVGKAG
jgi:hypothetical protein